MATSLDQLHGMADAMHIVLTELIKAAPDEVRYSVRVGVANALERAQSVRLGQPVSEQYLQALEQVAGNYQALLED